MSVLHVRFGFLRLFGLTSGTLIVDEVHAYDAYMSRILTQLLGWCAQLNIPVIMLSATLPARRKQALAEAYCGKSVNLHSNGRERDTPYPLITWTDRSGRAETLNNIEAASPRLISIEQHSGVLGDANVVVKLANNLTARGGCLCIVANTISSAQAIYREALHAFNHNFELLLFHSRFPAGHRNALEQRVLELFDKRSSVGSDAKGKIRRPSTAILVATQVVEQSLDLDFDLMITEVAPIDLMLQRAGRLHRHHRTARPSGHRPCLHVLLPKIERPLNFGTTERIYDRFILLKTLAVLHGRTTLKIPEDVRGLIEDVYDDQPLLTDVPILDDTDLRESFEVMMQKRQTDEAKAGQYLIPEPDTLSFSLAHHQQGTAAFEDDETESTSYFHAQTRLGDLSRRVLLLHDDEFQQYLNNDRCPPRAILRAMFQRLVNLPFWWLNDASAEDGFEPPQSCPRWLKGIWVLRLRNNVWYGIDNRNRRIVITDDEQFGVMYDRVEGGEA